MVLKVVYASNIRRLSIGAITVRESNNTARKLDNRTVNRETLDLFSDFLRSWGMPVPLNTYPPFIFMPQHADDSERKGGEA
ncbi:MAG: hypothetical protein ACXV5I_00725 [Halobacteriota archaeon]